MRQQRAFSGWLKGLAFGLLALLLVPLLALGLAVDSQPRVAQASAVSATDVARVYELLKAHAPDNAAPGLIKAAPVTERDLELLLGEAGRRLGRDLRPQARFLTERAQITLSLPAPGPLSGRWFNLKVTLKQASRLPVLDSVRLGQLPVPAWLVLALGERLLRAHRLEPHVLTVIKGVHKVSFAPQLAVVAYAWNGQNVNQMLADALLNPAQQGRLRVYVRQLAAYGFAPKPRGAPPGVTTLSQVLPPLFKLAHQRAGHGGEQAGSLVDEHRAAMLAVTLVGMPGALHKLLPAARHWGPLPPFILTLRGREDFALHFLVSAVIAAESGGPLADAVGIFKEVKDSRGGSGFSFNDIAADRAGTRFGLLAATKPDLLQRRLAQVLADDALLPPVDDLPEYLTAAEFHRRYGEVGSATYQAMQAEIERRLDGLPLLAAR